MVSLRNRNKHCNGYLEAKAEWLNRVEGLAVLLVLTWRYLKEDIDGVQWRRSSEENSGVIREMDE
jgi:hypothetical protein